MQRRVTMSVTALLLTVLSVFSQPAAASAQSTLRFKVAANERSALGELLNRGKMLETERRWGEALTLYEDSLRAHPDDAAIKERLGTARLHYDLVRRYDDASFRESLARMSPRQALGLYGEVLLKIQSHYVKQPNWPLLFERGTVALEIAMNDPAFANRHLHNVRPARIAEFRRALRSPQRSKTIRTRQEAGARVAEVARLGNASLGVNSTAIVFEYLCGAASSLDPYSTYLTSDELDDVYAQIEGNFVGLGVELKADGDSLLIVHVISNSPAQRAGIVDGDRIVAVDGRSTSELSTDQAADLLQGAEGSTVLVDIRSERAGGQTRRVTVRREHVEVPSVDDVKIVDARLGVGYLKLTTFQKTTTRDLTTALWKLHRLGMKSLIVDLRGNPGGLLTTSVEVVDKFVDRGIIVSTRGRSKGEDYSYSAHSRDTWRMPLVVLIDGDSASASEIFAGAISEHRRGTIVGARSYGKGSVQGIFPLGAMNAGVRLTTAKFYSPKGRPYSDVGVEPDVIVRRAARPVTSEEGEPAVVADSDTDTVLNAGLEVLRRQTARR